MLTYKSGADVTDSVDTLRTGAQRAGGLAQVPSALALLQVVLIPQKFLEPYQHKQSLDSSK